MSNEENAVRSVAADEGNSRASSSFLGGHRSFLLVCLAVVILLGLEAQESAWASPAMHGLRDTIPTMTPTEDPNATPTLHPSATPTATPAPGVEQIILRASDTYLDFWDQSRNYGSDDQLIVHSDGTEVGLLRFDLSEVPGDITLIRADLRLYAVDRTASRTATARVHRILRDWKHDEATWTKATFSEYWFYPGCSGLGTDRAVVAETTELLAGVDYHYSFEVTDAVAGWLADPGSNHGLLLAADAVASVEYTFASSTHQTPDYRPALVITYVEGVVTPTITPTGAPTSTPTLAPTPLTMVFQYGVSPEIAPGVKYEGVSDTYINAWASATNYGESWRLHLRSSDVEAALLRFDLSLLPPGAYVVDAELGVYVVGRSNTAHLPTNVYRVLRSWVDMEATWAEAKQSEAWGIAGCNGTSSDRVGVPEDSQVLGSKGLSDWWYYFDVSDMVSDWVTYPETNRGLILKGGEASSVEYRLASSNRPDDREWRPRLSVRYYLEAPATPTITETPSPTLWSTVTVTPTPEPTLLPGGVSGMAWNDMNENGRIDYGEPPLVGAEVILKNDLGVVLDERLTAVDGRYSFSDLASGWYRVCGVPPVGYVPTTHTEIRVWPGPGVILRVDFGVIGGLHAVVLPIIWK